MPQTLTQPHPRDTTAFGGQHGQEYGDGYRKGSVNDRTQFQTPGGNYMKRDTDTGRFMDQKAGGTPFKGVAKEPDGRRSKS